ncbi:MAG: SDR family oxidoreductase [Dehalococcoidia bacterium]|nr:SDR family oxidoreductase [Dehalococcoidia bacterium]
MDGLFSLEGKVAIVTGSSYGLGVIFAGALADAGADIVITARSAERLQETRKMIEAKGRRCLVAPADVTDYAQVAALMKTANDAFGKIDILVNNAGVSDARGLRSEHSEPETFANIVGTDLVGLWYCCHAAAQYMLRQGHGNIINISSIFGMGGFEARTPGYFASKGGVNNLTSLLACEWGDRGIRVNAIAPHFFDSEMTHEILVASGMLAYLEGRTPMRRIGQADDLIGPIVFLASDASKFVNGVVMPLDGGLSAGRGFAPGPFVSDTWDPDGRGQPLRPGTPFPGSR